MYMHVYLVHADGVRDFLCPTCANPWMLLQPLWASLHGGESNPAHEQHSLNLIALQTGKIVSKTTSLPAR